MWGNVKLYDNAARCLLTERLERQRGRKITRYARMEEAVSMKTAEKERERDEERLRLSGAGVE